MDADYWSQVIGVNVWTCRRAAGMTQDDLAKLIGSTVPSVSRLESGSHLPSLTTLLKVAEALGVSACRLLEEPKPKKGKK